MDIVSFKIAVANVDGQRLVLRFRLLSNLLLCALFKLIGWKADSAQPENVVCVASALGYANSIEEASIPCPAGSIDHSRPHFFRSPLRGLDACASFGECFSSWGVGMEARIISGGN